MKQVNVELSLIPERAQKMLWLPETVLGIISNSTLSVHSGATPVYM